MSAILIVENHQLVRKGLVHLIQEILPDAAPLEAATLREARELLTTRPEVRHVLLDLSLPDGHGLELLAFVPDPVPVTVLTALDAPAHRKRALDLGVRTFLSKDASPGELRQALLGVLVTEPPPTHDRLSPRESEVLYHLGQGLPTTEVARQLGMDEKTLYTHRRHLMQKLRLRDSSALLHYATLYWAGRVNPHDISQACNSSRSDTPDEQET